MADFNLDRLQSVLLVSGLQIKDPPLYQVITQLINAVREFQKITNTNINNIVGSGITNLSGDVVANGPGAVVATIQPNAVSTIKIADEAVTYAKIQDITANKLLGRSNSGDGIVQEITIGTNLSLSGTTLNATGGGSGDDYVVMSDGATPIPSPVDDGFGNFIYIIYIP